MRFVWRLYAWRNIRRIQRKQRLMDRARKAVEGFPTVRHSRPHGLGGKLVVTLTSYPPRFPTLSATLKSILDQDVRADHTVLWIAKEDASYLPSEVLALTDYGLEIKTCDNIKSYKKLIPALDAYPKAWFVTADDDVYYSPTWLKSLVTTSLKQQRPVVVANRAHLARLNENGYFIPYRDWEQNTKQQRASSKNTRIFPTGVGGVLYPPEAFVDEVKNRERFMSLCPHGDDIWFFWMTRLAGVDQILTPSGFDILSWPSSQEVALYHDNKFNDRNDVQICAMQAEFGPVL